MGREVGRARLPARVERRSAPSSRGGVKLQAIRSPRGGVERLGVGGHRDVMLLPRRTLEARLVPVVPAHIEPGNRLGRVAPEERPLDYQDPEGHHDNGGEETPRRPQPEAEQNPERAREQPAIRAQPRLIVLGALVNPVVRLTGGVEVVNRRAAFVLVGVRRAAEVAVVDNQPGLEESGYAFKQPSDERPERKAVLLYLA